MFASQAHDERTDLYFVNTAFDKFPLKSTSFYTSYETACRCHVDIRKPVISLPCPLRRTCHRNGAFCFSSGHHTSALKPSFWTSKTEGKSSKIEPWAQVTSKKIIPSRVCQTASIFYSKTSVEKWKKKLEDGYARRNVVRICHKTAVMEMEHIPLYTRFYSEKKRCQATMDHFITPWCKMSPFFLPALPCSVRHSSSLPSVIKQSRRDISKQLLNIICKIREYSDFDVQQLEGFQTTSEKA